ncbi:hypothetical protein QR680_012536 [Steinernema hermaphroditum]|uniref:RRM domain-containing protein n=1 Tax=Steinernema hermaphroditum TaxID=289476 RepID=A0AA39I3W8_9BILA|nr:hypothetical protein QR680_012536 [Steinernema hermaphroditum]
MEFKLDLCCENFRLAPPSFCVQAASSESDMVMELEEDHSREASPEKNGKEDRSSHRHHKHRERREHRRSRSRSHDREQRHRSRSGSNRSRTYDSDDQLNNIADARLHIADLDMSVRRRDIEELFSKYGRLEDIWLATYPPIYAFVVNYALVRFGTVVCASLLRFRVVVLEIGIVGHLHVRPAVTMQEAEAHLVVAAVLRVATVTLVVRVLPVPEAVHVAVK